ncbi:MAG TPA: hypothetical protein PLU87_12425 [Sedimentisphaerales bacterium]|nr:hypothetical protein [Sedimentisphaerales bacterium]HRS11845.1 hypothetical protein [Sedimentisphaerales bacterium]HRV48746.1 hypothetical protein [Sedimentisphaerales bacterium]
MSAHAGRSLTAEQIRMLLDQLERVATREACWSCECLQRFITELESDAAADARGLLEAYEVRPERRHGSLGCRPCPPAELSALAMRL